MSQPERPHEAYVLAIREQVAQHVASLNDLRRGLQAGPLTFIERTATERSLQIVIEAAIGCTRHLLRALDRPVPAEARAASGYPPSALSLFTLGAGFGFGILGYVTARRARKRGETSAFHWREEEARRPEDR
ncbi:MAG TPA: hypothetical protein VKA74_15630 [Myxococcota bacterium]|nr:hypothetical protein [Myxococcota bacterium]